MNFDFASWPAWSGALIGLFLGLPAGYGFYRLYRVGVRRAAELQGLELVDQARDQLELQELEHKEKQQELEEALWSKVEKEFANLEERIEELEETATETKEKLEKRLNVEKSKLGQYEKKVSQREEQFKTLETAQSEYRKRLKNFEADLISKLMSQAKVEKEALIQNLVDREIQEAEKRGQKIIETREADLKENIEGSAKEIIDRALSRFQRSYSSERGIAPVYFETAEQRTVLLDPAGQNLKTISELTGCDLFVDPGNDLLGVAGFDPVRRELTRRVLERCLKEKRPINPDFIKKTFENIKRELMSLIKRDGDMVAKELKLEHLHPEIRQMMGSLRYRYSFTQNQYFHCGEVGWLCGLLCAELGLKVLPGRRAGLLHDIGKSMDHELEGGHAVIGANFIEARGESAEVVHAVKSHHYDDTPSTDLAFLVIAADAISGARPGARRSTVESYNQKVTEMDAIARNFPGVTDCIILSGGRECRVMVDSRNISDLKAQDLSVKIAAKIQEECNYPGHIKVVVVRETVASEMTRAGA